MQPPISPGSMQKLKSCHPSLISLVQIVAVKIPLIVLEGHRAEVEQQAAFETGRSKLQYPHSLHNSLPALAVDLAPKPWDPTNIKLFYYFGGYVCGVASAMGLHLRWGGAWAGNLDFANNGLQDLCHFELLIDQKTKPSL